MHKLPFIILFFLLTMAVQGQSPHGDDFEMDCAVCHSAESWNVLEKDMKFNHGNSRFKLKGQHSDIQCKECHSSLVFSLASRECISCHIDVHQNTLGADCERCHNSNSWIVINAREIHRQGRFQLNGSHATTDCFSCHESASNLRFDPLGIACVDCHLEDYMATNSPNHAQSGYSTHCIDCHSIKAISWDAEGIDHSFFPITGVHAVSCLDCHTSGTFERIPNDCFSCHQKDYLATSNPNHQQLGFLNDCEICHSLDPGWKPARFDGHNSVYPLNGAHATIANDCAACHQGNFNTTPTTCFGCHEADFNSTTDPDHAAAKFNHECEDCHNEIAWEPSTFNHDREYFPIYSGPHRGTWNSCTDCHTTANNYSAFSCIECHEHNQNRMHNKHREVSGYSWQSSACFSCHPTGRE